MRNVDENVFMFNHFYISLTVIPNNVLYITGVIVGK